MTKHLRFCTWRAYKENENDHPQNVMKKLGVTYQHATPQSIADQWWFWNCENIPKELPPYLTFLDTCPMGCIGWGLDKHDAKKIMEYKSK